ncbi:MAG: hypothetical protein JXR91_01455 [Deltaproteobacteria bacterium]|nr:hypothetical protein [Deltaproteobacteria bacterium]
MRNFYFLLLTFILFTQLYACSDAKPADNNGIDTEINSDSDSDSNSDTDSDTDTDSVRGVTGDCSDDSDCTGGTCELVQNWQTCIIPVNESTDPTSGGGIGMDECINSQDCPDGEKCYLEIQCMGACFEQNVCKKDECQNDTDCPDPDNQICVPAGAYMHPVNTCRYTTCKTDSDCHDGSNGKCIPYISSCYSLPQAFSGFYCHYLENECFSSSDCNGEMCMPSYGDSPGFSCQMEMCPAK